MRARRGSLGTLRGRAALGLAALALLLRLLIPAGFMPATGQGLAITLCTGMGAAPAWVDGHGTVHKSKPAPAQGHDHPCAFAGFAAALDMPESGTAIAPAAAAAFVAPPLALAIAIGRGLAAPPPPSTGPPAA